MLLLAPLLRVAEAWDPRAVASGAEEWKRSTTTRILCPDTKQSLLVSQDGMVEPLV